MFLVAIAGVWLALFAVMSALPYIQNGAATVGQTKWAAAAQPNVFPTGSTRRFFFFGNSKVLAGFNPAVLEASLPHGVSAYNLAIPGEERYVDLLDAALQAGNKPTHVLVQSLPAPDADSSWLAMLRDDKRLVSTLFPFRTYLRDLIVFVYESRAGGGIAAQYRSNGAQIEALKVDKGYYFIKSQSHYPNDALPDDFKLPSDKPEQRLPHTFDLNNSETRRLLALAEKYDFKIVVTPVAFRIGEFAPSAPDALDKAAKNVPRLIVMAPSYYLYPPSMFSDPVHLNRVGADRFTRELAAAVSAL